MRRSSESEGGAPSCVHVRTGHPQPGRGGDSPDDQWPYAVPVGVATVVLEYIKVLIWPLVVAGVLIGYRRSAFRLLGRLTQVDAAGVIATFDSDVQDAEDVTGAGTASDSTPQAQLNDAVRFAPTTYRTAREFGEVFRDGKPVLLDLNEMTDEDAKRLVDFSAGLVFHARGSMDKVTNKVFMLTPRS